MTVRTTIRKTPTVPPTIVPTMAAGLRFDVHGPSEVELDCGSVSRVERRDVSFECSAAGEVADFGIKLFRNSAIGMKFEEEREAISSTNFD